MEMEETNCDLSEELNETDNDSEIVVPEQTFENGEIEEFENDDIRSKQQQNLQVIEENEELECDKVKEQLEDDHLSEIRNKNERKDHLELQKPQNTKAKQQPQQPEKKQDQQSTKIQPQETPEKNQENQQKRKNNESKERQNIELPDEQTTDDKQLDKKENKTESVDATQFDSETRQKLKDEQENRSATKKDDDDSCTDNNNNTERTADKAKNAAKLADVKMFSENEKSDHSDTKGKIYWKGQYVPLDNLQDILQDMASSESETEEDLQPVREQNQMLQNSYPATERDKQREFSDSASDASEDMNFKDTNSEQKETIRVLPAKENPLREKELQNKSPKAETENKALEKNQQLLNHEQQQADKNNKTDENCANEKKKPLSGPVLTETQESGANTAKPFRRTSTSLSVNSYADEIAILATENRKFDEILHHLQLDSEENQPEKDPVIDEMLASIGKYVLKEDFLFLEQEKLNMQNLLSEKQKQFNEKARELEEAKIDFEDKTKGFEKALKRLEERDEDKSKMLNEYEMEIFDLKRTFQEKLDSSESNLQNERLQKTKVQEELEKLLKHNAKQEQELKTAKTKTEQLELEEIHLTKKYKNELSKVQEKLEIKIEENVDLVKQNQNLLQDLMKMKEELSNESKKHSQEQKHTMEYIDEERMKLIGKHHEEVQLLLEKLTNPTEQNIINVHLKEIAEDQRATESGTEETFDNLTKCSNESLRSSPTSDVAQPSKHLTKDKTTTTTMNEISATGTSVENSEVSELVAKVNNLKIENSELHKKVAFLENELAKTQDAEQIYFQKELQIKLEHCEEKGSKKANNQLENLQVIEESTGLYFEKPELNSHIINPTPAFTSEPTCKLLNESKYHEHEITGRTDLHRKIISLQKEIDGLIHEKEELEKMVIESKHRLEEEFHLELERERTKFKLAEEEIASNAEGLKRVADDWEQMLKKTISKYEKELERSNEENAKLKEQIRKLENGCLDKHQQRTQNDSRDSSNGNKNSLATTMDCESPARLEERVHARTGLSKNEVDRFISYLESEQKRLQSEYRNHIDTQKENYDLLILGKNERIEYLKEENICLRENLKILEQKKDQEQKELLVSFTNEKKCMKENAEEHLITKLNENKKDYESSVREMKLRIEIEQKQLQENIIKSREVLQDKIENEFLRKVLKIIKESKASENNEVLTRMQEYKNKIRDLEKQIEEERKSFKKAILNLNEKFLQEQTNAEVQNKAHNTIMEKTIVELQKEIENIKQEKRDLKRNYKRDITQVEEEHEKEIKEINEKWKAIQTNFEIKLREETAEKLRKEREVYEEEVHNANCELRALELQLVKMETKFNAEKYEKEKIIDEMKFEMLSLRQMKAYSAENHFSRNFVTVKENIENNFYILRQEIFRLQGYIAELRAQFVNSTVRPNTQANPFRNLGVGSAVDIMLDDEYRRNEIAKERERYNCTAYDLQSQVENLKTDISLMRGKVRHAKTSILEDLDKERDVFEEKLIREHENLRTLVTMMALRQNKNGFKEVREYSMTYDFVKHVQNCMAQRRDTFCVILHINKAKKRALGSCLESFLDWIKKQKQKKHEKQ